MTTPPPPNSPDNHVPKILVADASPLSLLGTIEGALDWLFLPKCEVWLPDIIVEEVLRDPGEGNDRRIEHRAEIANWFSQNKHRIKVLETRAGRRYRDEMALYKQSQDLWNMAGRPAGKKPEKPDWKDRGDESVWVAVKIANEALTELTHSVIALADDGQVRDAIEIGGRRRRNASIDLMGTQTFIRWMAMDFQVQAAETAWDTIALARQNQIPGWGDEDEPEDPVYIRNQITI